MQNIQKKHIIKIPKNINIIYSRKKRLVIIEGPLKKESFRLQNQIFITKNRENIKVTNLPFFEISNSKKRKMKETQGTLVAILKQLIIQSSVTLYHKLKFVGIGYRAFDVEGLENRLFFFKLGYSHSIYFKPLSNNKVFCIKSTRLFIYGHSYQTITQTGSLIRSYKRPEPYKGKGILYENEKIKLKEGKKV